MFPSKAIVAAITSGGVLLASGTLAHAQDANHDNCYCPVGVKPGDGANVAHITNAWTCVSTERPGPPCAMTVWCLSDKASGPGCPDERRNAAGNFEAFIQLLPDMVAKHYASIGREQPFSTQDLLEVLRKYEPAISSCLAVFREAKPGDTIRLGTSGVFECVVLETGTLQFIVYGELVQLGDDRLIGFQFNLPR